MIRLKAFLMLALALFPLALAANDPGHDSLYVLLTGDSNVSGNINITQNLTASNIRAATLLYGDQLDIRANGTIQGVSSRPAIQAVSTGLYLDGNGNIYFNTQGSSSGVIQMGDTSTNDVTLNVSGTIRQQGVLVCLANGTNCDTTSGNVTGSGSTNTVPLWTSASALGDSIITESGSQIRVGGSLNATGNIYDNGNRVCTSSNGLCDGTPGGSDGQVQFNDGGSFGGDANFTWNGTTLRIQADGLNMQEWRNATATLTSISDEGILSITDIPTGEPTLRWTGHQNAQNQYAGMAVSNGNLQFYTVDAGGSAPQRVFALQHQGLQAANGFWRIFDEDATATNPVFNPDGVFDDDTGLGAAGTDQLSLIAGGSEIFRLSDSGASTENALLQIDASTEKGLVIQGANGQTQNLTEWQNNSGTILASINASGAMFIDGSQVCTANNGLCNSGGSGNLTGSGSADSVAKWQNSTHLTTGVIQDDGNVTIDTTDNTLFVDTADNVVGIGTTDVRGAIVNAALRVAHSDSNIGHVVVKNNFGFLSINSAGNGIGAGIDTTPTDQLDLFAGGTTKARMLSTGELGLSDTTPDAQLEVSISGSSSQTPLMISSNDANDGDLFIINNSGNVGIGDSTPGELLEVAGNINSTGGDICITGGNCLSGVASVAGSDTQIQFNDAGSFGADANFTWDDTNDRLGIGTTGPADHLHVNSSGTTGITIESSTSSFAKMDWKNANQNWRLQVQSTSPYQFRLFDATGSTRPWQIEPGAPDNSWYMDSSGEVGIGTAAPTQALDVNGSINTSGPGNIYYQGNLTGYGADLAELVYGVGDLEGGDVVVLDENTDEGVRRSSEAYDTAVAGIISTDPSHLMSADEGDVPLALAGRVPVKASAENGPIGRGDLLTTSGTAGHAMRCSSREECIGAIVGKAMEPLADGQGTITALVVLG